MYLLYKYYQNWVKDEKGQTVIEYGLICLLVALLAISGFTTMGTKVASMLTKIIGSLPS